MTGDFQLEMNEYLPLRDVAQFWINLELRKVMTGIF